MFTLMLLFVTFSFLLAKILLVHKYWNLFCNPIYFHILQWEHNYKLKKHTHKNKYKTKKKTVINNLTKASHYNCLTPILKTHTNIYYIFFVIECLFENFLRLKRENNCPLSWKTNSCFYERGGNYSPFSKHQNISL